MHFWYPTRVPTFHFLLSACCTTIAFRTQNKQSNVVLLFHIQRNVSPSHIFTFLISSTLTLTLTLPTLFPWAPPSSLFYSLRCPHPRPYVLLSHLSFRLLYHHRIPYPKQTIQCCTTISHPKQCIAFTSFVSIFILIANAAIFVGATVIITSLSLGTPHPRSYVLLCFSRIFVLLVLVHAGF